MTTGGLRPRRFYAVAALLLLIAAGLLSRTAAARQAEESRTSPILYLPSGRYLKVAALGFESILADAIFLWSIQYYSNYAIADRYDYLEQIYTDVISDLDPHYLDPYLVGAMIMNVEAHRPESALRLLEKGMRNNPGEWILPFEAGYVSYKDVRDYARAGRYFEIAAGIPGAHPAVRRFQAEMSNRAGDPRAALTQWSEVWEGSTDPYVRGVAWNHVHDLKVEVDLADLETAIGRFRESRGRAPARLEDLVIAGVVPALPTDPEGGAYAYAAQSGTISYRGSRVLGR
ncbi:MAG TPA: tetratricopeptide repeat protein [Candidatus Polarisedimenticolia bacterium]|nr:tetratricopeptide repeat protein [Candidatus Polarisedimenticolia bacterium]